MRSLALLVLATSPVLAEPTRAVTPVFEQIVAYDLPEGFVPAFEDGNGATYLQESVPAGQTVESWGEMITLTAAAGAAGLGPNGMLDSLAQGFAGACPASFGATLLQVGRVPGADAVAAAWLGCGTVAGAGYGEEVVVIVAQGSRSLYSLQWAVRFNANPDPARYSPGVWDRRLAALAAGFRLCDPVAGEGPPYPSCR
jgi:hypothetical protein